MINIEKIYEYNEKLDEALEKESEMFKKCKDGAKDRTVLIDRGEGEEEVNELVLWEEQSLGGEVATNKLRSMYKELFDLADERAKIQVELDEFLIKQFGFDPRAMNSGRLIKMIHEVVKYEIAKNK